MKRILPFILLLFTVINLLGQDTSKSRKQSPWEDTSYIPVKLKDTLTDSKVVIVEIGKKAIIYIKLAPILAKAKQNLTNDFVRENYKIIIHFLDSAAASKSDTIIITEYLTLRHFEYLVSSQLVEGNARVYYKRQQSFVDTISHRLERFGGRADRFFYLPDRRPFFAVTEFTGILDEDNDLGSGHLQAYVKEGKKLASLRKE